MTSDIQTDRQTYRQTYILPLVVLSAALQQKKQGLAYFGSAVFPVQDMIEKLSNVSNIL